jgi:hypothetical protein
MTAISGFGGAFNPAVAWCEALGWGVWFGNSGGGFGHAANQLTKIKPVDQNNPAGLWTTVTTTLGSAVGITYGRNGAACVGKDMYVVAKKESDGTWCMQKIDLETNAVTTGLPVPTMHSGDYFPQLVYNSRRHSLVLIGVYLNEYNLDTGAWANITPAQWGPAPANYGYESVNGVYCPETDAIYFRAIPYLAATRITQSADNPAGTDVRNFQWHRIQMPAGDSLWTLVLVDSNFSPFKGPPEAGFGGAKHVRMAQHPNGRVYTMAGDYGTGAGAFGQPEAGGSLGVGGFNRAGSLENDMYSINPLGVGTQPWRLEHPYLPIGGTEDRPGRPDQAGFWWDPIDSKYWIQYSVLRTEFLYMTLGVPDQAANGTTTTVAPFEPPYTYSWVPGVGGTNGTFTRELSYNLVYRTGSTSYSGNTLISGNGDERIGQMEYDALNDCAVCLSAAPGSTKTIYTFHPRTIPGVSGKRYQYRHFPSSGYSRLDCGGSYCAVVDGWAYAVAVATTTGGTRKSVLVAVNVKAALTVTNEGTLTSDMVKIFDLPWSLSMPIVNFDQGGPIEIEGFETVTGQTSGATGKVVTLNLSDDSIVLLDSGSWAGDNAVGYFALVSISGTFQSGETIISTGGGSARLTSAVLDGAWEQRNNGSNKWQEHASVIAIDRKVHIMCSYDELKQNGIQKFAVFSHDGQRFLSNVTTTAPENICANSWCALSNGDLFLGMNSTSGRYSGLRMWRWRGR